MKKMPDFLPVCIADLDAHRVSVHPLTLTESVVEMFEQNPALPGVMVIDRGRPTNVITRLKLFERLGHRYGVELFLRKPVVELNRSLRLPTYIMPAHLRVDDAVRQALQRPAEDLYDPIVVEVGPETYQLLEMNLLLMAQSHIVAHLSNAVKNLAEIEQMLNSDLSFEEIMQRIFIVLRQVIPHHLASLALPDEHRLTVLDASGKHEFSEAACKKLTRNAIYRLLCQQKDGLYIPDAQRVPQWKTMSGLGSPVAWLGIPLTYQAEHMAILSIGRNTATPFDAAEKDTARTFAAKIATLLRRQTNYVPLSPSRTLHTEIRLAINASL